jgi:hypothetical protein
MNLDFNKRGIVGREARNGRVQQTTSVDKAKLSVYLKNLIELGIVERELPVLGSGKEKASAGRGLYRVADGFFRFWYAFAARRHSELEEGDAQAVWDGAIAPRMASFAAQAFEEACHAYLRLKNRDGDLPFRFSRIGRWWGKAGRQSPGGPAAEYETEIDALAVDEAQSKFIVGECKFRSAPFDAAQLRQLMGKFPPAGAGSGAACHYYLFSKSGFTDAVRGMAAADDAVHLVTLDEMDAYFESPRQML